MGKWGFSDVMSHDFGSKIGQHSNASGMQDFKIKRNQQTPKDVKLVFLQNGSLGFSKFWVLRPPPKFRFLKNKYPKNPKF